LGGDKNQRRLRSERCSIKRKRMPHSGICQQRMFEEGKLCGGSSKTCDLT